MTDDFKQTLWKAAGKLRAQMDGTEVLIIQKGNCPRRLSVEKEKQLQEDENVA